MDLSIFNSVVDGYSIVFVPIPRNKHYRCVVDLLSQAGLIVEVVELSKKMPIKPDNVICTNLFRVIWLDQKLL